MIWHHRSACICVYLAVLRASSAFASAYPNPSIYGTAGQPPAQRSCVVCHRDPAGGTTNLNPPVGSFTLSINRGGGFDGAYRLGDGPYVLTFSLQNPDQIQGGIQVSVLDERGRQAGYFHNNIFTPQFTYVRIDCDLVQRGLEYVHHHPPDGLQNTGAFNRGFLKSWSIEWYPPPFNVGPVTFYAAAVSGDFGEKTAEFAQSTVEGDTVYTLSRTLPFGQAAGNADANRDGRLDYKDVFWFARRWQTPIPSPTPPITPGCPRPTPTPR